LQYVRQRGITEIVGVVFKEGMVRADDMPLVLPVLGTMDVPRGTKVRVKLGEMDEITLDIGGTLLERLDTAAPAEEPDAEDDDEVAGPIAIAMDVDEAGETPPISDNQAP
jgi:exoribonuclease II